MLDSVIIEVISELKNGKKRSCFRRLKNVIQIDMRKSLIRFKDNR